MTDRFFSPRNTHRAMQDAAEQIAFLADGLVTGGPERFIEAQEAAGQREFVNSDVIPTDLNGCTEEDLTGLGFKLGPVVEGDDMFRRAVLPDGWTREGSEHAMWSYLLDGLGRRRCSIFYKAAFYDRSAHLSVTTVQGYVSDRAYYGEPVVFDDEWATKDAVLAAIDALRAYDAEKVAFWTEHDNAKYVSEYAVKVADWDTYRATITAGGAS